VDGTSDTLGENDVDGALLGQIVVDVPLQPAVKLTSSSKTSDQRPKVSSASDF
jgi:hypothetical protein